MSGAVPPGEQIILCDGLPLSPDIELSSVGNGTTLIVMCDMHGRTATQSSGKKKKRGRMKMAQWAAYHQDAKHRSELLYEVRKAMTEAHSRPQEEAPFKDSEESMEHTKTT